MAHGTGEQGLCRSLPPAGQPAHATPGDPRADPVTTRQSQTQPRKIKGMASPHHRSSCDVRLPWRCAGRQKEDATQTRSRGCWPFSAALARLLLSIQVICAQCRDNCTIRTRGRTASANSRPTVLRPWRTRAENGLRSRFG